MSELKDDCTETPEPDAGAYPADPAPGTPEDLNLMLQRQHEQGGQHPTHIPTENEQRDHKP